MNSRKKYINPTNPTYANVIVNSIFTEKSTSLEIKYMQVTLEVAPWANKELIKAAMENLFNTSVASVNIINCKGKVKNLRGKPFTKPNRKKAVVKLLRTPDLNGLEVI